MGRASPSAASTTRCEASYTGLGEAWGFRGRTRDAGGGGHTGTVEGVTGPGLAFRDGELTGAVRGRFGTTLNCV